MALEEKQNKRWGWARMKRISGVLLWIMLLHPPAGGQTVSPQNDAVIRKSFQRELGREPDPEGFLYYRNEMLQEGRDPRWLREVLRHSPEGKTYRERKRFARQSAAVLLGSWLILMLGFASVGHWIWKGLYRLENLPGGGPGFFASVWMGLAGILGVVGVGSLVAPVNEGFAGGVCLVALCAGLGFLWRQRRSLPPADLCCRGTRLRAALLTLSLLVLTAVCLIAVADRHIVEAFDTRMYHLSVVRWMNTYPAVPGLGNLHIRLATPSAWFWLAALVDNGPLDGRSAWILPAFPVLLAGGHLLQVLFAPGTLRLRSRVFALLTLPYVLRQAAGLSPGLYQDSVAMMALLVWMLEVLLWLEKRQTLGTDQALRIPSVLRVALPAVLSFLFKPVAVVAVLVSGGLFFTAWAQHQQRGKALFAAAVPALLFAGWLGRNAILTGWLLFPAPLGKLPVDWSIPPDPLQPGFPAELQSMHGQKSVIQAWARSPGAGFQNVKGAPLSGWVPGWLAANHSRVELWLLFPLGLIGCGGTLLLNRGKGAWWEGGLGLLLLVQLGFWFVMAPDLRFGDGLFWIWMGWGLSGWTLMETRRMVHRAGLGLFACLSLGLAYPFWVTLPLSTGPFTRVHLGKAPSGRVVLRRIHNRQEPPLNVWVPREGKLPEDSPLPGTLYPLDNLMARQPGHLRAGFAMPPPSVPSLGN